MTLGNLIIGNLSLLSGQLQGSRGCPPNAALTAGINLLDI